MDQLLLFAKKSPTNKKILMGNNLNHKNLIIAYLYYFSISTFLFARNLQILFYESNLLFSFS